MVLLNVSPGHLWWQGRDPEPIEPHHRPALLAWPRDGDVHAARERLVQRVAAAADKEPDQDVFAKVEAVLEPVEYASFWNHGQRRWVVPVQAKRPYWMPDISDQLFYEEGFCTAEHDIPYVERATADLAAEKDWWLLDTKGRPATLDVMTYDIETTEYGTKTRDIPIDIIGYTDFKVRYEAQKDLAAESFDFRFTDLTSDWQSCEVMQLVARNLDEEMDNLMQFTQHAVKFDIVSGHNVLGFDNKQIHDRIQDLLRRDQRQEMMSKPMREWFERFTTVYSRPDRSFHFGTQSDTCVWYPMTLDTFHAARKFYFFHDDFTLKGLAPWLGIHVEDRIQLDPDDMKLDARTFDYNRHDVQEQAGLTMNLLAQALPLCFTVGLPMTDLLTGGNTRMWDHMALIRARRQQKIMPAMCRAQGVARGIQRLLPNRPFPTREDLTQAALRVPRDERGAGGNKELLRVLKQGPEMPVWCEHPNVVVQPEGKDHGYAIVGGMTLKPDSELKSHFVPWYHVVAADVGAMYPTILKARNLTADTVRPARSDEEPDDWIWLFSLDDAFARSGRFHVRKADAARDRYTKGRGWMVGVKHNPEPGLVNLAMTGILDTIQKVKDARARAKKEGAPADQVRILDMTYASLKAARNAGTHGILVAVNVSCRQFNVWGGANITTIGQKILHGTLEDFERRKIRTIYGDTDGLYIGCSKSAGNIPHFAAALGADVEPEADKWITLPDDALRAVEEANQYWRKELDYPGFELEPEMHDAMVFVVHKNYLIFDARRGCVEMETKGNNFKGSDKAPLAQNMLALIMQRALKEVAHWDTEEDARQSMQTAIKRATRDVMKEMEVTKTAWEHLVLRQVVQPVRNYQPNPDGTLRSQAVRTAALENLTGERITAQRKVKFVVCRDPLPLYRDPRAQQAMVEHMRQQGHNLVIKQPGRKGLKPLEYMWPIDKVDPGMVDWVWYRSMVEDYVKGAFGFDSLELAVQRDLSSWF